MHTDTQMSSKHCSICGGEGEGFACPRCGMASLQYNPNHFRDCPERAMMQVKCKACSKAEGICQCKN